MFIRPHNAVGLHFFWLVETVGIPAKMSSLTAILLAKNTVTAGRSPLIPRIRNKLILNRLYVMRN